MLNIGPEMISWLERKQAAYLWGQKSFIKPVFIEHALGNGDLLLAVTPLNTRPNYYLIRIDSNWLKKDDTETIYDHLDEIEDAIEEQCGRRDYEDDDGNECLAEWPALNINSGISWCNSNDLIEAFRTRKKKKAA
ncbi:MAG: hypothetical protein P4K93_07580 [Terracidiphilus sp.]|nr:hypothetical protein [Terracidiphilus sp.]